LGSAGAIAVGGNPTSHHRRATLRDDVVVSLSGRPGLHLTELDYFAGTDLEKSSRRAIRGAVTAYYIVYSPGPTEG
jgi:hypothetical protein